jgi:hypothetical protein
MSFTIFAGLVLGLMEVRVSAREEIQERDLTLPNVESEEAGVGWGEDEQAKLR